MKFITKILYSLRYYELSKREYIDSAIDDSNDYDDNWLMIGWLMVKIIVVVKIMLMIYDYDSDSLYESF